MKPKKIWNLKKKIQLIIKVHNSELYVLDNKISMFYTQLYRDIHKLSVQII